jgi:hypothetical protein
MPWQYQQDTGKISGGDGFVAVGFSGNAVCKNLPNCQDLKDAGPIPRGRYYMDRVDDSKGPVTIHLLPSPGNEMFGRSAFDVHGDSIESPGNGSDGCICAPRNARDEMNAGIAGGDVVIDVVLSGQS